MCFAVNLIGIFQFHFMTICTIVTIKKKIYIHLDHYTYLTLLSWWRWEQRLFSDILIMCPSGTVIPTNRLFRTDGQTFELYIRPLFHDIFSHTQKQKHVHNCKHCLFSHTQRVIVLRMNQWSLFSNIMYSNREDKYNIHT